MSQPRTPVERFATLILWLCRAVAASIAGGRLSGPMIVLIWKRINRIGKRFSRLAARIRAGRTSKRPAAPRPDRPPGPTDPLPKGFGWLLRLVPGTAAAASQLRILLADAEMAALLAAAPAPMGRALRPLCRMLGVDPSPILATPPPSPPPAPSPAAPAVERPAPRPQPPPPLPPRRAPTRAVLARACGPPHPA